MLRYKVAEDAASGALPTSYPITETPPDTAAAIAAPASLPPPQLATLKESYVTSSESQVPPYPESSKSESTTKESTTTSASAEPLKAGKYVHDASNYASPRKSIVGKLSPPLVPTEKYKEVSDKYNEASDGVAAFTLPAATYSSQTLQPASIFSKKPASLAAMPSSASSGVKTSAYLCMHTMLAGNSHVQF
jgi:hypothetical protein